VALTLDKSAIPLYLDSYATCLPPSAPSSVSTSLYESVNNSGPIYPPSELSSSIGLSTSSEESEWRLDNLPWLSQPSVYGTRAYSPLPTTTSQLGQSTPREQSTSSVEARESTPITTKPKSKRKLSQASTVSTEAMPIKRGRGRPRKVVVLSSSLSAESPSIDGSLNSPISTSLPLNPSALVWESFVADVSSPHSSLLVSLSCGSISSDMSSSSRGSVQQAENPLEVAKSRFWSNESMVSTQSLPAIGSKLF
jgi:hypothetical protein